MSVQIFIGDCREVLKTLPSASIHCVITSPPYWGLRDYGIDPLVWGGKSGCRHTWKDILPGRKRDRQRLDVLGARLGCGGGHKASGANHSYGNSGQFCRNCGAWRNSLGLEPTLELYVAHLVEIFREVRRVLRSDGTMWLNLGDSYAAAPKGNLKGQDKSGLTSTRTQENSPVGINKIAGGLKRKDLAGVPWREAFALQADGWWLRSDCVWYKPNCMPESVTDRPTRAHEYVFLLSKAERYFYDIDAIREPIAESVLSDNRLYDPDYATGRPQRGYPGDPDRPDRGSGLLKPNPNGRNKRTVWEIPTLPFPEAHFAAFPPALVEPMIKAGTSEKGCCPECGAPWRRVVQKPDFSKQPKRKTCSREGQMLTKGSNYLTSAGRAWQDWRDENPDVTIGWQPSCSCNAGDPIPCIVLDPFAGACTTGLVADRLGRDAIMIELKREYAEMGQRRIEQDAPMFADVVRKE